MYGDCNDWLLLKVKLEHVENRTSNEKRGNERECGEKRWRRKEKGKACLVATDGIQENIRVKSPMASWFIPPSTFPIPGLSVVDKVKLVDKRLGQESLNKHKLDGSDSSPSKPSPSLTPSSLL